MARQERERVETVRQAAESVSNVVRVSAEAPRRVAETAREAVQSGVGTATQMAQKAADFGVFSFSDVTRRVQNASAGMTAVAQASTGLAMRYQAIWQEVFQLAHQATQARTESMTRLMSVRSPQQLLEANVDLLKGEMQRFFDGQARLSQLSAEARSGCQAAHRGRDLGSEAERDRSRRAGASKSVSRLTGCVGPVVGRVPHTRQTLIPLGVDAPLRFFERGIFAPFEPLRLPHERPERTCQNSKMVMELAGRLRLPQSCVREGLGWTIIILLQPNW